MPRALSHRYQRQRIIRYILWAATALLVIAAFGVATPYIFLALGRIHPRDWAQFSNEGQAYGGIAAVIGMLAIAGVVVSLILQARESAANRVQMERAFHADLLRMSFEDPELVECWGTPYGDSTKIKKVGYVNLIVSYLYALFEVGRTTEAELRRTAAEIFAGSPARNYWLNARASWLDARPRSSNRRFIAILDEEYRRAVAGGPAPRWPERKELAPKLTDERSIISGLALGAICGATIAGATAALLRHSRR